VYRDTAGYGAIICHRELLQPLLRGTAGLFRIAYGVHGKAGGEHLGEHDQVAAVFQPRDDIAYLPAVVFGLFPGEFALDQRSVQISHNIPAACRSSASLLAKQKRRS
jgi:hypothetical protein